jgi:soluble lytic murein transglycosylase-like protein
MRLWGLLLVVFSTPCCLARRDHDSRHEAEYYVAAYAQHYGVPLDFVRALIQQESGWHPCVVSSKGAVGLMQLMPETARRLGVQNRCDLQQNVSGGVRYLAELMERFHGDLRLVAAAYYAGEHVVGQRGLNYRNPDVVAYVRSIGWRVERERRFRSANVDRTLRSRR